MSFSFLWFKKTITAVGKSNYRTVLWEEKRTAGGEILFLICALSNEKEGKWWERATSDAGSL